MTKEELKKEAEEYALNQWEGNLPWSVIQKAYYDGALPREKQIQIDAEQIRALQKQNGELTDKVKELETENEQIKNSDSLCKLIGEQKRKITDLEAQNEQMKCCGNCEWKAKGVCNGNDTCGLKEWKLVETRR